MPLSISWPLPVSTSVPLPERLSERTRVALVLGVKVALLVSVIGAAEKAAVARHRAGVEYHAGGLHAAAVDGQRAAIGDGDQAGGPRAHHSGPVVDVDRTDDHAIVDQEAVLEVQGLALVVGGHVERAAGVDGDLASAAGQGAAGVVQQRPTENGDRACVGPSRHVVDAADRDGPANLVLAAIPYKAAVGVYRAVVIHVEHRRRAVLLDYGPGVDRHVAEGIDG